MNCQTPRLLTSVGEFASVVCQYPPSETAKILSLDHQLSDISTRVSLPFALNFCLGHLNKYQKHEGLYTCRTTGCSEWTFEAPPPAKTRERDQFKSPGDRSKNYCVYCLLTNADIEGTHQPETLLDQAGVVLHHPLTVQGGEDG